MDRTKYIPKREQSGVTMELTTGGGCVTVANGHGSKLFRRPDSERVDRSLMRVRRCGREAI